MGFVRRSQGSILACEYDLNTWILVSVRPRSSGSASGPQMQPPERSIPHSSAHVQLPITEVFCWLANTRMVALVGIHWFYLLSTYMQVSYML